MMHNIKLFYNRNLFIKPNGSLVIQSNTILGSRAFYNIVLKIEIKIGTKNEHPSSNHEDSTRVWRESIQALLK